jgi:hypothetical protein
VAGFSHFHLELHVNLLKLIVYRRRRSRISWISWISWMVEVVQPPKNQHATSVVDIHAIIKAVISASIVQTKKKPLNTESHIVPISIQSNAAKVVVITNKII